MLQAVDRFSSTGKVSIEGPGMGGCLLEMPICGGGRGSYVNLHHPHSSLRLASHPLLFHQGPGTPVQKGSLPRPVSPPVWDHKSPHSQHAGSQKHLKPKVTTKLSTESPPHLACGLTMVSMCCCLSCPRESA